MKKLLLFALLLTVVCLTGRFWQQRPVNAQSGGGGQVASENGDVNGDGNIDIADAMYLIDFLFAQGPEPVPCPEVDGGAIPTCEDLPTHAELQAAVKEVVEAGNNSGLANEMWATLVNRDGVVCAVAFSGESRGDQWPGSRVISAQKANTANAFSLPHGSGGISGLPLSTANLYSAVQPGGSLFGLQFSNPVNPQVAYGGNSELIGHPNDPMVGEKIGGVNVFGGGLPLYNSAGELVGALGVSGDFSCTDHIVAWKIRHKLNLDTVIAGVSPTGDDNIIFDIVDGTSSGGFGHPVCSSADKDIAEALPETHPIGPDA